MAEECIFCSIVAGKIPSSRVFEDEKILAFLDINPVARGHTLVIPKAHYRNLLDLPEEEVSIVYKAVKKVALAVKKAVGAEGILILQANEKAALQAVFHSHTHIIPKWVDDTINKVLSEFYQYAQKPERLELEELAEEIRKYF
ncbi:MAG: HIT family protein [Candidatus Hodarchaeota archaeon]